MIDEVERAKMLFREKMRTLFNQGRQSIPGNDIGTLLVYKTFDRLSYDVILAITDPTELFSEVVSFQHNKTFFFVFYTILRLVNLQNPVTLGLCAALPSKTTRGLTRD